MRRNITEIFVVGTIVVIFAGTPALADRDPTPEERFQVEAELQYLGFTSYDDIDFDEDGYWEIEDARDADGQEYDLHLTPEPFQLLKEEAEEADWFHWR